MSGIYIHGMEMPKGIGKTITIYPNGMVRVWANNKGSGELLEQRAVPVPEHGRLIDADALREEVKKHATPSNYWVFSFIRTAPTIIPADTPEEGEG